MNIRTYYWRDQHWIKNLGDDIAVLLLDALGYHAIHRRQNDRGAVNEGRCLWTIGSLLSNDHLAAVQEPVDVWGGGWRGEPLSPERLKHVSFHAVRGPRTRQYLHLPDDIPLGDPALLLPQLCPRPIQLHGRTLVVPHYHQTYKMSSVERCRLTRCDELLSTQVVNSWFAPQKLSLKHALAVLRAKTQLAIPLRTTWQAVERIAGASFVLTGSLHGAILAQAYDVPWAAYDDGYVNLPEKWLDWGEYLGVDVAFVSTLAQGQQWWEGQGQYGRTRDLCALMATFPYPVADEVLKRFA